MGHCKSCLRKKPRFFSIRAEYDGKSRFIFLLFMTDVYFYESDLVKFVSVVLELLMYIVTIR